LVNISYIKLSGGWFFFFFFESVRELFSYS